MRSRLVGLSSSKFIIASLGSEWLVDLLCIRESPIVAGVAWNVGRIGGWLGCS